MERAVTVRMLENSNIHDPLNSLLRDLLRYCVEYGCSIDDSMNDFDAPLAEDTKELMREAAEHILGVK